MLPWSITYRVYIYPNILMLNLDHSTCAFMAVVLLIVTKAIGWVWEPIWIRCVHMWCDHTTHGKFLDTINRNSDKPVSIYMYTKGL